MKSPARLLLSVVALWCVSSIARAAFLDTYVEPCFFDCGTTVNTVGFQAYGATSNHAQFDLANHSCTWSGGPPATTAEDGDSDPIFTTLSAALANTSANGTVHLLVPGIYRESVTVSSNVTIKGLAGGEYILDGMSCAAYPTNYPATPGATGLTFGATGLVVVLENVTFRNFTTAVSDGANDHATNVLKTVGCRFEENETGIDFDRGTLEVFDSLFLQDGVGVTAGDIALSASDTLFANSDDQGINGAMNTGSVTLTQCRFVRNGDEGLKVDGVNDDSQIPITIEACEFVGNGSRGIHDEQGGAPVLVSNTLISGNVSDGIYIKNTGLTGPSDLWSDNVSLRNTRIVHDGGDGIESVGTACSPPICLTSGTVNVSLFKNTIAFNGGYGLNPTGNSVYYCQRGDNEFMGNVSGYDSSGTNPCAQSGTSTNQKN